MGLERWELNAMCKACSEGYHGYCSNPIATNCYEMGMVCCCGKGGGW
jgi:hypothetical protein